MRLRKLEEKDVAGMLAWMHDPMVNQYFQANFAQFGPEEALGFINGTRDDDTSLHMACVDDNDEYLGTVSLKNIDKINRKAEYAISFGRAAQGTGAAKYATLEILRIGFAELGLNRVYLNVLADNERANGFYRKIGFFLEGTSREDVVLHGEAKSLNWYSMLARDWRELKL